MYRLSLLLSLCVLLSPKSEGQDDLLSLLGEEETTTYATAAFKTTRVINLHSLENVSPGVLDFKISHRFGFVNGGISELFGIDQATIRFGFDYGLTDRLMIGVGRSSFEKTYDGLFKLKILRQSSGAKTMPVTVSLFGSAAVKTVPFQDPDKINPALSRWYYTSQLIIGRKFSDGFSMQVSPTYVHRNLVQTRQESHGVIAIPVAGRLKLNKRVAINAEYIYVLPDQLAEQYRHSVSIGFDIETGGHVFQLHFTNSTSMIEKGFITETVGDWLDGDIHFGFNISRVFTLRD